MRRDSIASAFLCLFGGIALAACSTGTTGLEGPAGPTGPRGTPGPAGSLLLVDAGDEGGAANGDSPQVSARALKGLDISPVITHRFPYFRYEEAFQLMKSGQSGKIILDWSE